MNNVYYIYFNINTVNNEIFYVGKGTGNRYKSRKRNKFWKNVTNKYEYSTVIIKNNISEKYAFALERAYIKLIGRRDLGLGPLVNLTDGGEGSSGYIPTEETRLKLSNNTKGEKNPFYNRKHTEEALIKCGNGMRNKKHTEETKIKISESNKGKIVSDETRLKQSISLKGKSLGRKHTEETKQYISLCLSRGNHYEAKKVLDTKTGIIYDCIKDAAENLNINYSSLVNMLSGHRKNKTNLIKL